MTRSLTLIPLLAALVAALSFPTAALARSCGGVEFPNSVTVAGERLSLNGLGIREATVFNVDVYVAGLYVATRARTADALLDLTHPIVLDLRFVRDVDSDTMNEALVQGFTRNAGGNRAALQARIDQLQGWVPNLTEGMNLVFTWLPGQGLQMKVDGRVRGVIPGEDFASVFFRIWLGPQPPNRGLRTGLLGGACG
ncbi:MAG: chalcone isomerase family protein [Sandaracinaceae bacterium]|nr:chalcone isomerase family protein [Sandaracinaceae bacterium]